MNDPSLPCVALESMGYEDAVWENYNEKNMREKNENKMMLTIILAEFKCFLIIPKCKPFHFWAHMLVDNPKTNIFIITPKNLPFDFKELLEKGDILTKLLGWVWYALHTNEAFLQK